MNTSIWHVAGLFDGPWMFFVIVLAGALINWLTKRRQEEAERVAAKPKAPPTLQPSGPPADWEDRLRRMLGDEVVPPPLIPPIVRQPSPAGKPPVIRAPRDSQSGRPPQREMAPVPEFPAANHGVEETVRRFEQLDPAVMTPVRPLGQMRQTEGGKLGATLRRRDAARQAFIASLVFGPPKALGE